MTRALTGISVGGALPLLFSLLSDMFGEERRNLVSAIVGGGTGAGIALGQMIAGFVGPKYGWRAPFLIVSLPAFFCAAVMMLTLEEPRRGCKEASVSDLEAKADGAAAAATGSRVGVAAADVESGGRGGPLRVKRRNEALEKKGGALNALSQNKTAILIFLQGIPGCLPWGLVYVFLNDYLSNDCGLEVGSATLVITMFGVGCFFGLAFGGTYGQMLHNREPRKVVIFMATAELGKPGAFVWHVLVWIFYYLKYLSSTSNNEENLNM